MKKFVSLTISLLLALSFCSCGGAGAGGERPSSELTGQLEDIGITTSEAEAPINKTVVYIPLDDRPNNYECMAYRAQALGYGIVMPNPDLFRNRLNGQPANSNGTLYGDRAALYEWILSMEEWGYNYYVIFLDMLLSGGLVNSRAMQDFEPVTLSDGSTISELEMLENLFTVLGADPNNRVWLLDTDMRLAPTVGYLHWNLADYNNVRSYFAAQRPVITWNNTMEGAELADSTANTGLNGVNSANIPLNAEDSSDGSPITSESFGVEEIFKYYTLGADGRELNPADYKTTKEDVAECINSRRRKMYITEKLLKLAAADETGIFRVLYGIDDSSNSVNVQTNELAYISAHLSDNGWLLSGTDDMCFKALGKMFLEDVDWQGAGIDITYIGGAEDDASSEFDYASIKSVMEEHLRFFDMHEEEGAELRMFVITRADDESREAEYVDRLVDAVNTSMAENHPVILVDDTVCTYDGFPACLTERVDLGKLLAYSGRLDMANIIGTAVSHGVSRYAFLLEGKETSLTNAGHMRTISDCLIKDFCYRNILRGEMDKYVRESLGGDYNNFYSPCIDVEKANAYAAGRMEELAAPLVAKLESGSYITGLAPYTEGRWADISLGNFNFPWHRTFELTFNIWLDAND